MYFLDVPTMLFTNCYPDKLTRAAGVATPTQYATNVKVKYCN